MKEIGEKLKEAREEIGISKEEVCEDLKIDMNQIDNLEEGNMDFFSDILALKLLIKDYAKYLGLDKDNLLDEFNEFLFDYTSKISLEDIKQAKKDLKKDSLDKIQSPYTIEKKGFSVPFFIIYILIFIVLVLLGYFIYSMIGTKNSNTRDIILSSYGIEVLR